MTISHAPLGLAAALLACTSGTAIAQSEPVAPSTVTTEQDDREIIVTARRTNERLQDVPVAVTAVSGDALERRQSANIADVEAMIPNATFFAFGGSNNNASVYIRGVGQADQLFMFDPGVGIYLDDAYIGRAQGALFETLDIARVEVLRGPQGTLYGKNTSGGALKVYTRDPDLLEAGAQATATGGSYDYFSGKASFDLPIVEDRAGIRASVLRVTRDGVVKNLNTGDDLQDRDYLGGQVTALARIDERLTARLTFDIMRDRSTPAAPTPIVAVSFPPNLPPFSPQSPLPPRQSKADTPVRNDQDSYGFNGQLAWRGDQVEIKSITSYRRLKFRQAFDYDSFPYLLLSSNQRQRTTQFSQELQANFEPTDNLSFVGGLYYFEEKTDSVIGVPNTLPLQVAPGVFVPLENSFTQLTDLKNKSYAAYLNAVWEVTDRLSISGGLRYTDDRKKYLSSLTNDVFPTGNFSYDLSDSWSRWLPRIGIDFKITPDQLVYASYGTGFKSGGFNPRAASADVALSYKPETSETYEIGYKSTLVDRKLTFNAAAFYNRFKDYQTNLIAFVGTPPGPTSYFTNAGRYESWGAEAELTLRATQRLTLKAQASLFDDKFATFVNSIIGDFADKTLPNAPKFTTSLAATYVMPLGATTALELDGDVAYRSSSFINILNSPLLHRDAYAIANARMALSFRNGDLQLFAGVRNLTDKDYVVDGVNYIGATYGFLSYYYNEPRTYYGGLRVRF